MAQVEHKTTFDEYLQSSQPPTTFDYEADSSPLVSSDFEQTFSGQVNLKKGQEFDTSP